MSFESWQVLIVDDDEDDAFFTGRLLETLGFAQPFTTARSASDAMALIEGDPTAFQVVFLDIRMPLVDGLELLGWIRSRPDCQRMKVVMLTSSDDANDIQRAQQLGAHGYLLKRLSPEKCAAILSSILPATETPDGFTDRDVRDGGHVDAHQRRPSPRHRERPY